MNATRQFFGAIALAALAGLPACGDGTAPPKPGTATVSFVTPNTDDGAVLVSLTGPGVRDAQAASFAYKVYWRVVSANELRLIVVGDLAAGVVATVTVDDVNKIGQYHATMLEVASRADVVRASTTGYSVTMTAQ
jgi:hypothetical protein